MLFNALIIHRVEDGVKCFVPKHTIRVLSVLWTNKTPIVPLQGAPFGLSYIESGAPTLYCYLLVSLRLWLLCIIYCSSVPHGECQYNQLLVLDLAYYTVISDAISPSAFLVCG